MGGKSWGASAHYRQGAGPSFVGACVMQSRLQSFIESCLNVAIGYGIALASQILVFPWFGINIPLRSNIAIGAIFTVISIVRSYLVRRAFNRIHGMKR